MSNDMHQQYLESKYEMVEHGIKTMPGLENMRTDLKDDLINHVASYIEDYVEEDFPCLLYTSPRPRDLSTSRMPSSA